MFRLHILTEKLIHRGSGLLRLMSTVISKLIVTGGQWVDGEKGLGQQWRAAGLCGCTQCVCVCMCVGVFNLTSKKHFRNKSIYNQITLPIALMNDALCSGSWTEKVWSSSSWTLALFGTLLQTLHLYSWKCLSVRREYSVQLPESLLNLAESFSSLMK